MTQLLRLAVSRYCPNICLTITIGIC